MPRSLAAPPAGTTRLRGEGTRYDVIVGDRTLADGAWRHLDSPVKELRDLVRIEWDAVDAWFEEEVEVDGATHCLTRNDQPREAPLP